MKQELKAELAAREVDSEGVFEDQIASLRQLLREALAQEAADELRREHEAELAAQVHPTRPHPTTPLTHRLVFAYDGKVLFC